MEKKIKAILFDLGNVVIKLNVPALYKGFSEFGDIDENKITDFIMDDLKAPLKKYMEGGINSSRFYTESKRLLKLDISYTDFYNIWNSMFLHYPEMEDVIRLLKEKYPDIKLVLISNTNEAHYEYIKTEYSILDELDGHVVSHEFGKQKPDRTIFVEAMKIAGTIPKETFYTDDRPDLIEAARTMGMKAFQFTGHDELISQLARLGLELAAAPAADHSV